MAINDYDQNQSQVLRSIENFLDQPTKSASSSFSQLRHLIDLGEYQQALGILRDRPSDAGLLNLKAVLLMRTGKPGEAANLLRPHVWDLKTFTLKPEIPVYVQLNFATALLMTGNLAGCIEIVHSINAAENEQANDLLDAISRWEKSLSILGWLDWKICGIEHLKNDFPFHSEPGRFGWKPASIPAHEELGSIGNAVQHHHDLAC